MPPPMTTASAAFGRSGLVSTRVSGAGMGACRSSSDEILVAVIGAENWQEPRLAEITGNGWPVEIAPGIEVRLAIEHFDHDRAHVGRHVRAVPAVAHRVEEAVALARARQTVARHVDHAAPAIVDAGIRELGEYLAQ